LLALLDERERLLRDKDQTIADLRRQVQKLTKKLRAMSEPLPPTVYTDPERQFRWEVEQHWLTTVSEHDRAQWPLAPYLIGRDWLVSLQKLELAGRRKVLDVVVEVLSGRVVDNSARRLRRLRSADQGGAGPRIRQDGAVGWRCNIKYNSASAPQMMWWKLPDNTIELGRVAAHDDMLLR
jgi:hypothetical protein